MVFQHPFESQGNIFFKILRDQIKRKFSGWKEQLLSKGGKEVIIKSMAFVGLVFSMNCFKLPFHPLQGY